MVDTPNSQNMQGEDYGRPVPNYQYTPQAASQPPVGGVPERTPLHFLDKRMIIPLAIIVLLLIAVMLGFYLWNMKKAGPEETAGPNIPGPGPSQQKEALSGYSLLVQECEDIGISSGAESRNKCFLDLAQAYQRTDFCDKIDVQSGAVSIDACYASLAILTGRSEYCFHIEFIEGNNSYNYCMFEVAKVNNNPYLCSAVSSDEGKYSRAECIKHFNLTETEFAEMYAPKAQ